MNAPLSRISLLLAILLFATSLFQRSIANAIGNPLSEPTQLEQVIKGAKGDGLFSVPKHPVPATIFWIAMGIVALALWAWIVEDSFWIPLVAMGVALSAWLIHLVLLPVAIAAVKAGGVQAQRRSTRRRSSTIGATTPESATTRRHRSTTSQSLGED